MNSLEILKYLSLFLSGMNTSHMFHGIIEKNVRRVKFGFIGLIWGITAFICLL